jgi:adenylyl cyclase-associated protein
VIEDTQPNQSVYAFRCEGSTIKVTGKCNNIILDGCKKTAVVFDNVVSSCEFINCQSVQMQVSGEQMKRAGLESRCREQMQRAN